MTRWHGIFIWLLLYFWEFWTYLFNSFISQQADFLIALFVQVDDLSRMYRLFCRIPKGLEPVAQIFKQVDTNWCILIENILDWLLSKLTVNFCRQRVLFFLCLFLNLTALYVIPARYWWVYDISQACIRCSKQ